MEDTKQAFYITSSLEDLETSSLEDLKIKTGSIPIFKTESSNIYGIGYRENLLYVLFNNLSMYSYENVPKVVVRGLFEAVFSKETSLGSYFYKNIKTGGYTFKKVEIPNHLKIKH